MAGRIPQSFIDELMARVDIVEVIDRHVPLKKAGRDFQACCPFHSEKTPSFTVSPAKQFYHCFGCGAHGTALGFLMDYEHLDFVDAVEELAGRLGLAVPREQGGAGVARDNAIQGLYEILDRAAAYYQQQLRDHPTASKAVDYLKTRGLSGEIAKSFGIGYAPPGWDNLIRALGDTPETARQLERAGLVLKKDGGGYYDRFRDRVQFPIRDRRGRVIGFGGRVLGQDTPKYLNSPETPVFHKGSELYGMYEARKQPGRLQRLLVVEGYMDVVALAQFGIRYAVATLGTSTTPEHVEQLFRAVPQIIFCFDGDPAGRKAAWRALETTLAALRDGREARFLFLPEGEDPDSLVRKEGKTGFESRIDGATPCSEFFFATLSDQTDTGSLEGRARLAELARPLLSNLPEGVYRRLMFEKLEKIAGTGLAQPDRERFRRGPQSAQSRGVRQNAGLTPVRHAIRSILHHPELANEVPDTGILENNDIPGVALLRDLIDFARRHPGVSLGAILEHWRGQEDGPHLEKLARLPLETPESGLVREFLNTLELLDTQHFERRYQFLHHKLQDEGLTASEKNEWKQLLTVRHRPSV